MPVTNNIFKTTNKKPKTKIIHAPGAKPFRGRVYREQDGNFMSVTSIIHPEPFDFPEEKLKQYAARGLIVHALVEAYLKDNIWLTPEETSLGEELELVQNGSLGLSMSACNPKGFFEQYGADIKPLYIEKKLKNREHHYMGRADIIGKYKGKLAILDVKTSGEYEGERLDGYWMQLAAYAHCMTPIPEYMVILPINPTSTKGYDTPIVSRAVKTHFSKFLKQLEYVKNTYQIPSV